MNWILRLFISASLLATSFGAQADIFDQCKLVLTRAKTHSEYMDLKSENPNEIKYADIDDYTRDVLAFYKKNYSGRNILIFTDASWDQKSGVITVMKILQQKVKEMSGMNVVFITPEQFNLHFNTHVQDVRVAYAPKKEVLGFMQQYNPAAIHIMVEGSVGFQVKSLLDQAQVPYTSAYHTDFPKYFGAKMPLDVLNRAVTRLGYNVLRGFHANSSAIMAPTQTMGNILKENGFPEDKIVSWSHGVEVDRFKPELRDENLFQRILEEGLASGKLTTSAREIKHPISLFVGRIEKEKNLDDFLNMNTPGTKIFIGDGASRLALQKKYPDAVFLGKMPYENLPAYYASADLFVFTSLTDTFGLVMLEAAASGTPVLAYNIQGPVDVVGTTAMGVLAPYIPNNPAANVRALEERFAQALALDRNAVREEAEKHPWESSIVEFLYFLQPLTQAHLQSLGVQP